MDDELASRILCAIDLHDGPIQTFFLKKQLCEKIDDWNKYENTFNELIEKKVIEYTELGLNHRKIHLAYLLEHSDDIVRKYFSGININILSEQYGLSVSDVKKHILGTFNTSIEEDKYASDYQAYRLSMKLFTTLYDEPKETFRYLQLRYMSGKEDPVGLSKDMTKSVSFKDRVNGLLRKSVKVEGEEICLNPEEIVGFLLKKKDGCIEESKLLAEYNLFIRSNGVEDISSLSITSNALFTIGGKENNILYDKGKMLKYVLYKGKEALDFIRSLRLENYTNKYISAALIFNQRLDFMKGSGIENEFQLYNFIKKYDSHLRKFRIQYVRTPSMAFGKGNDYQQIERLLKESGRIKKDDFYKKYENLYGIKVSSSRSTHGIKLRKYVDGAYFDYNLLRLSSRQKSQFSKHFTKSWYLAEDAEECFTKRFGVQLGKKYFNSFNLDSMGYCYGSDIVYSKDNLNPTECVEKELLSQKRIHIDAKASKNTVIKNILTNKKKLLELLPLSSNEFMSLKQLRAVGINKPMMQSYIEAVISSVNVSQYFTLFQIRDNNFVHELEDFGFDDVFYETILMSSPRVKCNTINNTMVFVIDSQYRKDEAVESMVSSVLGDEDSMDEYDLNNALISSFGIDLDNELKSSKILYYNSKSMKVYRDKESYYGELRGNGES